MASTRGTWTPPLQSLVLGTAKTPAGNLNLGSHPRAGWGIFNNVLNPRAIPIHFFANTSESPVPSSLVASLSTDTSRASISRPKTTKNKTKQNNRTLTSLFSCPRRTSILKGWLQTSGGPSPLGHWEATQLARAYGLLSCVCRSPGTVAA